MTAWMAWPTICWLWRYCYVSYDAPLIASTHADRRDSKAMDNVGKFYKAARQMVGEAAAAMTVKYLSTELLDTVVQACGSES